MKRSGGWVGNGGGNFRDETVIKGATEKGEMTRESFFLLISREILTESSKQGKESVEKVFL